MEPRPSTQSFKYSPHRLPPLPVQSAEATLEVINKDLLFLKEQCTVSEVNIARLHNHAVEERRRKRAAAVADGSASAEPTPQSRAIEAAAGGV